jgi:Colicin V production protein
MWLDAGVLVLILLLAWRGSRTGATAAGLQLASLPIAYAAALLCAWAFGPALARELGWSDAIGGAVAATIGLFGVQGLRWLGARALRRHDETPPPTSQALGAVFGALRGALYALPILWLAGLAEGARVAGIRPELPDLSMAQLPALGGQVIGAGAEALLDEKEASGRLTVHLASRPAETVVGVQQVLHDSRVTDLQRDAGFWEDVERGAVSAALARPPARALIADRAFRARLAGIGAVSPEAGRDAGAFEVELALALAEVGPKLEAVRADPALASLLEDPAVRIRLQRGETLSLVNDPRFRSLMSHVTR